MPTAVGINIVRQQMISEYTEQVRIGARRFGIQEHLLRIESARPPARPSTVDLRDVLPEAKLAYGFQGRALKRSFVYVCMVGIAAMVIRQSTTLADTWIALGSVVIASPGLHVLAYFSFPVRVAKFSRSSGAVAFDIISARGKARELDQYAQELSAAIRQLQDAQPASVPK